MSKTNEKRKGGDGKLRKCKKQNTSYNLVENIKEVKSRNYISSFGSDNNYVIIACRSNNISVYWKWIVR